MNASTHDWILLFWLCWALYFIWRLSVRLRKVEQEIANATTCDVWEAPMGNDDDSAILLGDYDADETN